MTGVPTAGTRLLSEGQGVPSINRDLLAVLKPPQVRPWRVIFKSIVVKLKQSSSSRLCTESQLDDRGGGSALRGSKTVKLTGPHRSTQDTASQLVMGGEGGCSDVTLSLL